MPRILLFGFSSFACPKALQTGYFLLLHHHQYHHNLACWNMAVSDTLDMATVAFSVVHSIIKKSIFQRDYQDGSSCGKL